MKPSCSIAGCRRVQRSGGRGLCDRHYYDERGRLGARPVSRTGDRPLWLTMIARCHRPAHISYKHYGARGVSVCQRWRGSYDAFAADMGPRPSPKHTVDRINSDGNYEPGNCRWATQAEQQRNRRNNRLLTINGETMTAQDWAERVGVKADTLRHRLYRGLTAEQAVAPITSGSAR